MAEREGFEPPEACTSAVFKTAALNHSTISPKISYSLHALSKISTSPKPFSQNFSEVEIESGAPEEKPYLPPSS